VSAATGGSCDFIERTTRDSRARFAKRSAQSEPFASPLRKTPGSEWAIRLRPQRAAQTALSRPAVLRRSFEAARFKKRLRAGLEGKFGGGLCFVRALLSSNSRYARPVDFPVDGAEHRGLDTCPTCSTTPVPLKSLDYLFGLATTSVIDVLKIDAEGADVDIIRGAAGLLSQGRVRSLLFEVHNKGSWRETSLCSLVEGLSVAAEGMECFHVGENKLLRLSGGCCADQFIDELRRQGPAFRVSGTNVFCTSSEDLLRELGGLTLDMNKEATACPEAFDPYARGENFVRCGG